MSEVKTTDVVKLRKTTGAGMMDCKKALVEAGGDYDKAIEIIRKKGQAIANKRADRDAAEGVVLAGTNNDRTSGALIVVNCETDFVAKNEDFVSFAASLLQLAVEQDASDLDAFKSMEFQGKPIESVLTEQVGKIGEKIEISFLRQLSAAQVTAYVHPGNQFASLIGLNMKVDDPQVGKDVAMQVAAMNPVAVDKEQVPKEVIDKELEIGKEQARRDGKPEQILDKIATGKLNKYFRDNTLLNQDFIKENKKTIAQYLSETSKDLTVTDFVRYSLKD